MTLLREFCDEWRSIWRELGPIGRAVFLVCTPAYFVAWALELAFGE
jgi:hypothetical protein